MWSVFKATAPLDDPPIETADATLRAIDRATRDDDLVIRGWYDVAGLRADADLMVWWHAPTSDTLQDAYHALRRSDLGIAPGPGLVAAGAAPAGGVQQGPRAGVHGRTRRPRRTCASIRSSARTSGTCCPEEERRAMLTEHGMMARPYPDVRANTVSVVRARRLRVDPGLRGGRAAPDRRPDAALCAPPRPGGTPARRCRSTPAGAASCRHPRPLVAAAGSRRIPRIHGYPALYPGCNLCTATETAYT